MRKETREVFVSEDGKSFDTEDACLAHEKEIRKQQTALGNLTAYEINHNFDATEGKGYFGKTCLLTDCGQTEVIAFCLKTFGPPLVGWYGDGYYVAWGFRQAKHLEAKPISEILKYSKRQTTGRFSYLRVLSTSDFTWAGLPPSISPKVFVK